MIESIIDRATQNKNLAINGDINLDQVREEMAEAPPEDQMRFILENVLVGQGKCSFQNAAEYDREIDAEALVSFSPEDREGVVSGLASLINYNSMPIITDGFGSDHGNLETGTGRRGWRKQMNKIFGPVFDQVYDRNKLKWNKISNVANAANWLEMILASYDQLSEIKRSVVDLQQTVGEIGGSDGYDKLDLEQKKTAVLNIEKSINFLLANFGQSPASPSNSGS